MPKGDILNLLQVCIHYKWWIYFLHWYFPVTGFSATAVAVSNDNLLSWCFGCRGFFCWEVVKDSKPCVGVDLVPPIPLLGKFILWSHFNSFFFLNWITASMMDHGAGSLSNLQFPLPPQCTHATGALCAVSCQGRGGSLRQQPSCGAVRLLQHVLGPWFCPLRYLMGSPLPLCLVPITGDGTVIRVLCKTSSLPTWLGTSNLLLMSTVWGLTLV